MAQSSLLFLVEETAALFPPHKNSPWFSVQPLKKFYNSKHDQHFKIVTFRIYWECIPPIPRHILLPKYTILFTKRNIFQKKLSGVKNEFQAILSHFRRCFLGGCQTCPNKMWQMSGQLQRQTFYTPIPWSFFNIWPGPWQWYTTKWIIYQHGSESGFGQIAEFRFV